MDLNNIATGNPTQKPAINVRLLPDTINESSNMGSEADSDNTGSPDSSDSDENANENNDRESLSEHDSDSEELISQSAPASTCKFIYSRDGMRCKKETSNTYAHKYCTDHGRRMCIHDVRKDYCDVCPGAKANRPRKNVARVGEVLIADARKTDDDFCVFINKRNRERCNSEISKKSKRNLCEHHNSRICIHNKWKKNCKPCSESAKRGVQKDIPGLITLPPSRNATQQPPPASRLEFAVENIRRHAEERKARARTQNASTAPRANASHVRDKSPTRREEPPRREPNKLLSESRDASSSSDSEDASSEISGESVKYMLPAPRVVDAPPRMISTPKLNLNNEEHSTSQQDNEQSRMQQAEPTNKPNNNNNLPPRDRSPERAVGGIQRAQQQHVARAQSQDYPPAELRNIQFQRDSYIPANNGFALHPPQMGAQPQPTFEAWEVENLRRENIELKKRLFDAEMKLRAFGAI